VEAEEVEEGISAVDAATQLNIAPPIETDDGPIFAHLAVNSIHKLREPALLRAIQLFRDLEKLGVADARVLILTNATIANKIALCHRPVMAGVVLEYTNWEVLIIQIQGRQHQAAVNQLLFQLTGYAEALPLLNNVPFLSVGGNIESQEFGGKRPDGIIFPRSVPIPLFGHPGAGSARAAIEFEDKHRSGVQLRRHGLRLFNEQFPTPFGAANPIFPLTLRALILIKVFRYGANRRVLVTYYEKVGMGAAGAIEFREALSIGNAPVTSNALKWQELKYWWQLPQQEVQMQQVNKLHGQPILLLCGITMILSLFHSRFLQGAFGLRFQFQTSLQSCLELFLYSCPNQPEWEIASLICAK
jgi:hypothetical protein